jgi:hypothetical protein
MREMEILRFPREVKFAEVDYFIATRLTHGATHLTAQASALASYAWSPNDEATRRHIRQILQHSGFDFARQTRKAGRIQHEWQLVASIFHTWYGLEAGGHQERRGGASLSKAIAVVAAHSKGRGTSEANLWRLWQRYKDVAHIVTAACAVCRQVRLKFARKPFALPGFTPTQFLPVQMIMLMPELVVAVAIAFERQGLEGAGHAQSELPLDPETVWRIPADINVAALSPPEKPIIKEYLITLNQRRAGNRGKALVSKTTPIFQVSSGHAPSS